MSIDDEFEGPAFEVAKLRDLTPFPWNGRFWFGSDRELDKITATLTIFETRWEGDEIIYWHDWADGNYYEVFCISKTKATLDALHKEFKEKWPEGRCHYCYKRVGQFMITPFDWLPFST